MGWKLHIILAVAALAQTSYGQCPPKNVIKSDDKDALDVLELSVEGVNSDKLNDPEDILLRRKDDGTVKRSEGIFLTSNDIVKIETKLGSDALMSITEFSVELLKANFAYLTLKGLRDAVLFNQSRVTATTWTTVEFDLGEGIIDVNEIILGFFGNTGELKIRNIFVVVCIKTGWCPWQSWSTCSKSCGGGGQSRERVCECPNPDPKKYVCVGDETDQSQICNPDCCKKPPKWGSWTSWGDCSVTCENGIQSRTRKCIEDPCPDGTKCPGKSSETQVCKEKCCPQPPKWGSWTSWGVCSVTCEDGIHSRTRKCIDDPCPDGTKCPGKSSETQVCKEKCCPMPPAWTSWKSWGKCSVTCGGGTRSRTRKCVDDECPDGSKCPGQRKQKEKCNEQCCPMPPKWGSWTTWGDCSVTCEDGIQSRTRKCIDDPCPDGTKCPGKSSQTQVCTEQCCPQPPKWGSWSSWGDCSVTCEDGIQSRTRKCIDDPCPDGTKCPGKSSETQVCTERCCPQPPKWESWSSWGDCSVTCEDGIQSRTRKCIDDPCPDGTKCPGKSSQTQVCTERCCPQPPEWSKWGQWEECSVTCGGGTQSRKRRCVYNECPDNTECPGKSSESRKCNEECCPIRPEWSAWTKWSDCSVTCGSGSKFRTRKCKESPCPGPYKDCLGPNKETMECQLPCCEMIIDWKSRGKTNIMIKNGKSVSAKKVLRGSKRSIFLLSNDEETQYLDVKLSSEYTVLELGVETLLSNTTTVSSKPTPWPPGKSVSIVPEDDINEKTWNRHRFKLRPDGVGPIDNIRLDFGFPTGEIKVRKLFLIVCPPEY